MANKEFDFNNIGKRMPYTIPDGFFDTLEADIWKEVKPAKSLFIMRSVIAVAASIAVLIAIHIGFSQSDNATINDVDQAFSHLTTSDQAYLIDVYQNDVFINE